MSNSKELIAVVKKICDQLRSKMEVTEYRDYIMGFLFFKYLSEQSEKNFEEFKERVDYIKYSEFDENHEQFKKIKEIIIQNDDDFFLAYKYSFQNVVDMMNQGKNVIPTIEESFNKIESINSELNDEKKEFFKDLFTNIDFSNKNLGNIDEEKEKTIQLIIKEINTLNLSMDEVDHFGNTYEYLLSEFASDTGKKAGEFYTPSKVAELLVKIVSHGKNKINKAYDPACGSGSLLIKLANKVGKYNKIYGQEVKTATYNLARMNFILRGVPFSKLDLRSGDTLINPLHIEEEGSFDCIVANPPFSQKWNPTQELSKDRRYNPYPSLAPKSYADFAFLQHMLFHVNKDNGIIASVFSLGILSRKSPKAEEDIRKYIIDKNYIDTIIFLPPNLFYNTGIESCIIVARKNKPTNDKRIFMINATKEFQNAKKQNTLSDENINRIFSAWKEKREEENFSKYISYEDIVKNEYSLSMRFYDLDNFDEESEDIDIDFVESEIVKINEELLKYENEFKKNLNEFLNKKN